MSAADKPGARGTALQPAPLAGIDKVFGRDLRGNGWVVDPAPDAEQDSADGSARGRRAATPNPAMIWALRSRRK